MALKRGARSWWLMGALLLPSLGITWSASGGPLPGLGTALAQVAATPVANPSVLDAQGNVKLSVTRDLAATDGLAFNVVLDTHAGSLDTLDLKALATLSVDAGPEVKALSWTAAPGGHHRTGRLVFPRALPDGQAVLRPDAERLTLTVHDVGGIVLRALRWNLRPAAR